MGCQGKLASARRKRKGRIPTLGNLVCCSNGIIMIERSEASVISPEGFWKQKSDPTVRLFYLSWRGWSRKTLSELQQIGAWKITSTVLKGRNEKKTFSTSTGNNFWEISGIFQETFTSTVFLKVLHPDASAPVVVLNQSPNKEVPGNYFHNFHS